MQFLAASRKAMVLTAAAGIESPVATTSSGGLDLLLPAAVTAAAAAVVVVVISMTVRRSITKPYIFHKGRNVKLHFCLNETYLDQFIRALVKEQFIDGSDIHQALCLKNFLVSHGDDYILTCDIKIHIIQ